MTESANDIVRWCFPTPRIFARVRWGSNERLAETTLQERPSTTKLDDRMHRPLALYKLGSNKSSVAVNNASSVKTIEPMEISTLTTQLNMCYVGVQRQSFLTIFTGMSKTQSHPNKMRALNSRKRLQCRSLQWT